MTMRVTPIGRAAAVIASSRPYGPASVKARVVLAAARSMTPTSPPGSPSGATGAHTARS